MVNNPIVRIVASTSCKISQKNPTDRARITNGPIYDLNVVKDCLKNEGFFIINEAAQLSTKNEFSPELSDDELIAFINELEKDDWIESERCSTSVNRTIDCDGYAMKWNRAKRQRWEYAAKIYVKIGFMENRYKVLIISIHPSKY